MTTVWFRCSFNLHMVWFSRLSCNIILVGRESEYILGVVDVQCFENQMRTPREGLGVPLYYFGGYLHLYTARVHGSLTIRMLHTS
jgi:hypothetical protein